MPKSKIKKKFSSKHEYEEEIERLKNKIRLLKTTEKDTTKINNIEPPIISIINSDKKPTLAPLTPPPPPPPPLTKTKSQNLGPKPSKKLKGLFWTKIKHPKDIVYNPLNYTAIWDKIYNLRELPFTNEDRMMIDNNFCIVENKKLKRREVKPKILSVLDQKRSTQIGIIYSSLPTNILQLIDDVDIDALDEDQLSSLITILPTDEEIGQIENQKSLHPSIKLGKSEEFIYDLWSVPHFLEKIKCLHFMKTFHERKSFIENSTNIVQVAIYEIRLSSGLPGVLKYFLMVGNYMNFGSNRGEAFGFSYTFIEKLKICKSNENVSICKYINSNFISKYLNTENLPNCKILSEASKIKISELNHQIAKLKTEFNMCKRMSHHEKNNEKKIFTTFFDEEEEAMNRLVSKIENIIVEFEELLFWLGEPIGINVDSGDFFLLWLDFVRNFRGDSK